MPNTAVPDSSTERETIVEKDAADELVYVFDFDSFNLGVGVALTSFGTFDIDGPDSVLTKDNEAFLTGSTRKTTLRLLGGTPGEDYVVSNTVTTNETPAQKKKAKFTLRIKAED
jgi:hypothetical protein